MDGYIFWKGDMAIFTGKIEHLYGGKFYQYRLTEGHRRGDFIVSQRKPRPFDPIEPPSVDGPGPAQCDELLGKKHYAG